jgi:hypothetical protein
MTCRALDTHLAVVFIRDTLALGVTVDAKEATPECETDARGLLGMDSVAPDLSSVGLTRVLGAGDSCRK